MSAQLGGVGDIYCCGRSSEGKLKAPADHLRARKVSFLFGKYSRAALLEDGRVFWLDGGAEKDLNFRIADVKQLDFGESHMLVLKNDGRLYSWGVGTHGQLGIGAKGTAFQKEDLASSDLYLVWPLENVRVKQVSCGGEHSAAVTEDGDLYIWGRGYEGQLGLACKGLSGEENDRLASIQLLPKLLPTFLKRKLQAVSCGHRFTAAVTVSGEVWTWGEGGSGQLGYGPISKQTRPRLAIAKDPHTGAGFSSVSCGNAHAVGLTRDGRVWAWGLNSHGQLGQGDDNRHQGPVHVNIQEGVVITDAQAVGHSSGALSVDGVLYTWGSNSQSKLFHTGASNPLSPASPRKDKDKDKDKEGDEEEAGDQGERDEEYDSRTQKTTNARPPLPRRAVYRPRRVSAFDGQYVARFVLAQCNAYAFTPAQVRGLSLRHDPVVGGSELELYGIGFFDSPTLVVRFQPVGGPARAALGTFMWDKITNTKYISVKTPRFARPGDVTVELSLNGQDFTANGLTYTVYAQPQFHTITPKYSNVSGCTTIKLEGEGLFDSNDVKVRFVDDELTEVTVDAAVIIEDLGRSFDPLTGQETDETLTYLQCVTPCFPSPLPKPVLTHVEVAMNGRYFEPLLLEPQNEGEEEEELLFTYHDAAITSIAPRLLHAEGGLVMELHGTSFFDGLQVRVGIFYGEPEPVSEGTEGGQGEGGGEREVVMRRRLKYAVLPAMYERAELLRVKMPSTRYVLGRDESNASYYDAQLEVLAGSEVLTSPLPFHYYNDPTLTPSTPHGPLAGESMLLLTSTDRPITSEAEPLVRFLTDDGVLDVTLRATVLRTTGPDGKEECSLQVSTPALPASLHPAAPVVDPSQPLPVVSLVPVSLTFALNGLTFARQTISYAYYRPPVVKEISPVDGIPGDRILLKGLGFFESPCVRVRLTFGDGPTDTLVLDAAFEGDATQISFLLPVSPVPIAKYPFAIPSLALSMNGLDFHPVTLDNGNKSTCKLALLDPSKPKKKK